VQAPVTGIVLVIEMTASFTMLLPMIAACFAQCWCPTCCAAPRSTIRWASGFFDCSDPRQLPPLLEREMHEQKIAVDHQQGTGDGEDPAQMDERP